MPEGQPRYKRILLKLSGEAGVGGEGFGIDPKTLQAVAEDIAQVVNAGVQVCVVVGGGNISAAPRLPRLAWNAPAPTTWACWPL
jgi:uridylate kinase